MSNIIFEIGEMYKTAEKNYVILLGEVQDLTLESIAGATFYDNNGEFYNRDGQHILVGKEYREPDRDISMAAPAEETHHFKGMRPRVNIEAISFHPGYVRVGDPEFRLEIGGIYINRMGFLTHIESVTQVPRNRWTGDNGMSFDDNGQRDWDGIGMWDLIFQVRDERIMENLRHLF